MSRPRSVDADRISTALRLPRELHTRLNAAAGVPVPKEGTE